MCVWGGGGGGYTHNCMPFFVPLQFGTQKSLNQAETYVPPSSPIPLHTYTPHTTNAIHSLSSPSHSWPGSGGGPSNTGGRTKTRNKCHLHSLHYCLPCVIACVNATRCSCTCMHTNYMYLHRHSPCSKSSFSWL